MPARKGITIALLGPDALIRGLPDADAITTTARRLAAVVPAALGERTGG